MSPNNGTEVTMVLDTGAGPNIVATRALRDGWQSAMINKKPIGLCAADGKPISTYGYMILWVRLGDYATKDEFLVCDNLPTTMLLGAKFIDKNVAAVHVAKAQVELKDATRVPTVREEKSPKFLKDVPILTLPANASKAQGRVHTVNKVVLPPGKQTRVRVQADMKGRLIVDPSRRLLKQLGVAATNGVHKVNEDCLSYIYIAKFLDKSGTLAKRMLVARVLEGQATLLLTNCAPEEIFSILADEGNIVSKEMLETPEGE